MPTMVKAGLRPRQEPGKPPALHTGGRNPDAWSILDAIRVGTGGKQEPAGRAQSLAISRGT